MTRNRNWSLTPFIFVLALAGCATRFDVQGHRGARGLAPENTLPAFEKALALGVTTLVATQVIVNVGMVTGLIPVVGIPLPFMSYGGSSMVVSMMALGLLLSVRMRQFQ